MGRHPVSGMPLSVEYRLFFFDRQLMASMPYWDHAEASSPLRAAELSPLHLERASQINSRFFTMDIALANDHTWPIIELGDSQVSGLPDHADLPGFYRQLHRRISGQNSMT